MPDTLIETTYTKNGVLMHTSRFLLTAEGETKTVEEVQSLATSGGMSGSPVVTTEMLNNLGGGMATPEKEVTPAAPENEEPA